VRANNLVARKKATWWDLVAGFTMNNQSGKTFENAKIKLMRDVNKIQRAASRCFQESNESAMAYDERVPPSPKSPSTNSSLFHRAADDVA